jgi:hypothetical protein
VVPLTAVAAVLLGAVLVGLPSRDARAQVLVPLAVASRQVPAVHVRIEARTRAGEPFGQVDPAAPPVPLEAWVEPGRARIDKPGRTRIFDGTHTVFVHPERGEAFRRPGGDTDLALLSPEAWIEDLLADDEPEVEVWEERGGLGTLVLSAPAPELHGRAPSSFDEFDRQVEVVWDLDTHLLEGMVRRVRTDRGWVAVWEVTAIEHGEAWPDAIYALPDGLDWPALKPAPPEIDALPPREAARRLLAAAVDGDWETVGWFTIGDLAVDDFRDRRPTAVLEVGEPYRISTYAGVYVPYRIEVEGVEHAHDLALRDDNPAGRWVFDGGF